MDKKKVRLRIERIIKNNMTDYQFSVGRLADEMGLSYTYLYEIINDQYCMSPHCLIETYRMEQAVRLISDGHKMIRIYKELGYGSVRSFREAFCKRLSMNYTCCRGRLENCGDQKKEQETKKIISELWNT